MMHCVPVVATRTGGMTIHRRSGPDRVSWSIRRIRKDWRIRSVRSWRTVRKPARWAGQEENAPLKGSLGRGQPTSCLRTINRSSTNVLCAMQLAAPERDQDARFPLDCATPPDLRLDRSAVIFAPHQDDETLGCGGTIILKAQAGPTVTIVFLTDGSTSHRRFISAAKLTQIRKQEALAAAELLGITSEAVHFLDFPDGRLSHCHGAALREVSSLLGRDSARTGVRSLRGGRDPGPRGYLSNRYRGPQRCWPEAQHLRIPRVAVESMAMGSLEPSPKPRVVGRTLATFSLRLRSGNLRRVRGRRVRWRSVVKEASCPRSTSLSDDTAAPRR